MDLLDRMRRFTVGLGFSRRVREISRRFGQSQAALRLNRARRPALGISLLLASLVFGIWARDLAQAEALSGWLRGHPPSIVVWRHALESRGYQRLIDPAKLHRASKTLPSLVEEESSTWISGDSRWIAIYSGHREGVDFELYCLQCGRPAEGWEPAGRGWEAFDPTLTRADAAAQLFRPVAKIRAVRPRDPRELWY